MLLLCDIVSTRTSRGFLNKLEVTYPRTRRPFTTVPLLLIIPPFRFTPTLSTHTLPILNGPLHTAISELDHSISTTIQPNPKGLAVVQTSDGPRLTRDQFLVTVKRGSGTLSAHIKSEAAICVQDLVNLQVRGRRC